VIQPILKCKKSDKIKNSNLLKNAWVESQKAKQNLKQKV
jgi:hypothetical protein